MLFSLKKLKLFLCKYVLSIYTEIPINTVFYQRNRKSLPTQSFTNGTIVEVIRLFSSPRGRN